MRVLCTRIFASRGEEVPDHPNISAGKEYVVFAIHFPLGEPQLVISNDLDDSGASDGQWPIGMFVVTDDRIPSNWAVTIDPEDGLIIGPRAWLRDRFWEDFHSSGPERRIERLEAFEDYRRERAAVLAES